MLCAHTVRRLKPGALEEFGEAVRPGGGCPPGWVRFHLPRGPADENEIVTFGFFDGMLEELARSQAEGDYEGRRAAIEPYVDAVLANGVTRWMSAGCRIAPRRPSGPPGATGGSCRRAEAG